MVFAPVSPATASERPLQSTELSVICTGCGPHSLVANSNKPSCAKKTPTPMAESVARPARSGWRRATSLPAGSTRVSEPCLSFSILPRATVMLNPDVPVSYAVIVMVCGNLTCATAGDAATAVPAKAIAASLMTELIIQFLPFGCRRSGRLLFEPCQARCVGAEELCSVQIAAGCFIPAPDRARRPGRVPTGLSAACRSARTRRSGCRRADTSSRRCVRISA